MGRKRPPGPGWWLASDGYWYPPETNPNLPKPPNLPPPPPKPHADQSNTASLLPPPRSSSAETQPTGDAQPKKTRGLTVAVIGFGVVIALIVWSFLGNSSRDSDVDEFGFNPSEVDFINDVFDASALQDYVYSPPDSELVNLGQDICSELSAIDRPTSNDLRDIIQEKSERWTRSDVENMLNPSVSNGPYLLASAVARSAISNFCPENRRALN